MSDLEQRLQAALGETYRILKELGGGGMGRVFLAEETRLGHQGAPAGDGRGRERRALRAGIRRGRWQWYRARGWAALAEGRARDAVTAFTQGRNLSAPCADCGAWEEGVAYERANLPDSALAAYLRAAGRGRVWKTIGDAWGLAPSLKRLGELYEARGDRQRAQEFYGRFVDLWKDADPSLQPAVPEVRSRMAQLAGEGK